MEHFMERDVGQVLMVMYMKVIGNLAGRYEKKYFLFFPFLFLACSH